MITTFYNNATAVRALAATGTLAYYVGTSVDGTAAASAGSVVAFSVASAEIAIAGIKMAWRVLAAAEIPSVPTPTDQTHRAEIEQNDNARIDTAAATDDDSIEEEIEMEERGGESGRTGGKGRVRFNKTLIATKSIPHKSEIGAEEKRRRYFSGDEMEAFGADIQGHVNCFNFYKDMLDDPTVVSAEGKSRIIAEMQIISTNILVLDDTYVLDMPDGRDIDESTFDEDVSSPEQLDMRRLRRRITRWGDSDRSAEKTSLRDINLAWKKYYGDGPLDKIMRCLRRVITFLVNGSADYIILRDISHAGDKCHVDGPDGIVGGDDGAERDDVVDGCASPPLFTIQGGKYRGMQACIVRPLQRMVEVRLEDNRIVNIRKSSIDGTEPRRTNLLPVRRSERISTATTCKERTLRRSPRLAAMAP